MASLRGSSFGEVEFSGSTQANATWRSSMLFGNIPGIGDVIMRFQPSPPSTVQISANQPGPFFPATAVQTLNWQIDVLNNGQVVRTLITRTPATMQATINSIPPFGTTFLFQGDTLFFESVGNPASPSLVLLQNGSSGAINNPGGLDVTEGGEIIDEQNGTYSTTWTIVNVSPQDLTINWFATGLHGVQLAGNSLAMGIPLAAGGSLTIPISGAFDPSQADAGIVLHAVSVGGPLAEGHYPFYFSTPIPAVDAWGMAILVCAITILAVRHAWRAGSR